MWTTACIWAEGIKRSKTLAEGSESIGEETDVSKQGVHQGIYEHLSGMRKFSCEKRDCSWKAATGGLPAWIKLMENRGGKSLDVTSSLQKSSWGSTVLHLAEKETELQRGNFNCGWGIHLNIKSLSWERRNLIFPFSVLFTIFFSLIFSHGSDFLHHYLLVWKQWNI